MADTPPKPAPNNSLAVPPYLRPSASRHHSHSSGVSNSSSRSRPHHQNEYIPTTAGNPGMAGIEGLEEDDVNAQWGLNGTHEGSNDSQAEDSDEEDWDTIREGSISRRPAWRRPRPAWIYPFIIGVAISIGMSVAPRQELYINLACLAHPPRQPSSMDAAVYQLVMDDHHIGIHVWQGDSVESINASLPVTAPVPTKKPLSAADQWFLKLQHDIYEYEIHHMHHSSNTTSRPASPTATRTYVLPSAPIPHPTTPNDSPAPTSPPEHTEPETEGLPPYRTIDPALCKRDPKVQAAAARLQMIMTFTMGLLSALTAGYWGQTSDRIGRTKIIAIVEFGVLLNELNFVLVASFPYLAPGGYRALLIGPVFEGLLGGFATIGATMHAYVSDVTPDGSRATAFAKLGGIIMAGFALGPALGAMFIRATGNIMAPFYLNICIHIIWIPLILLLLPESLSTEARQHLTKTAKLAREAAKRKDAAQREWEDEEESPDPGASGWSRLSTGRTPRSKRFKGNLRRASRRATGFLQPLAIFLPKDRDDGRPGKDWNLTAVGAALFFISLLMGVYAVKAQFAFYSYGWTAAELGPYMSLLGFCKGFMLIVVIPFIMKRVKARYPQPAAIGVQSDEQYTQDSATPDQAVSQRSAIQTAHLDLIVARISIAIEFAGFVCLSFGPPAALFVGLTVMTTLGTAAGPAAKSLALSQLPSKREAGRLFGALSVADALGSSLLSPLAFGTLFSVTVGIYAPAVFILAAVALAMAFISLAFVRLGHGADADAEQTRGRTSKVKRVKSGAMRT